MGTTLFIGGCVLLIAAGLWTSPWFLSVRPGRDLPIVNKAGLDPGIVTVVERGEQAVRNAPKSAASWGLLGQIYLAHDFRNEASQCFRRAQALDPQDFTWPYCRALAIENEQTEESIALLKQATSLCGDDQTAPHMELARLLHREDRVDEAAGEYALVLKQVPEHGEAHLGMARIALQRGDLDLCLQHARQAAHDPRVRKTYQIVWAELQQRLGKKEEAEKARRIAQRLPEDINWVDPIVQQVVSLRAGKQNAVNRASYLLQVGADRQAVALLEKAAQSYPDSDAIWSLLGTAYLKQGQFAKAESALRRAATLAPESIDALNGLGFALHRLGKDAAAIEVLQRAIALKPEFALPNYTLGHCLVRSGDHVGAAKAFRTVLRFRPEHTEARLSLAAELLTLGRPHEALTELGNLLEMDAHDARALRLLVATIGWYCAPH